MKYSTKLVVLFYRHINKAAYKSSVSRQSDSVRGSLHFLPSVTRERKVQRALAGAASVAVVI